MDNDFYFEDANPAKVVISILCFLLVIGAGVIYFYIAHKNNTLTIKNNVKYEIGTKINTGVDYFIKNKVNNLDDYKLDLSNVNEKKVGTYSYYITYKNITKKGTIKIVDTTSPIVGVTDLTVGLNDELVLDDFITLCDDYSKPCKVNYFNENDANKVNKEGTYSFKIIISDMYNNKTTKSVNLTVKKGYNKENNRVTDFNISSISPSYDDYDNSFTVKYDKAITEDEIFGDSKFSIIQDMISEDLHDYISSEYENNQIVDTDIIYIFNKYEYVIGYSIRIKLDNGLVFYLKR